MVITVTAGMEVRGHWEKRQKHIVHNRRACLTGEHTRLKMTVTEQTGQGRDHVALYKQYASET